MFKENYFASNSMRNKIILHQISSTKIQHLCLMFYFDLNSVKKNKSVLRCAWGGPQAYVNTFLFYMKPMSTHSLNLYLIQSIYKE